MNFNPQLGDAVYVPNNPNLFNRSLGAVPVDSATGTNIGNTPVFNTTNAPVTKILPNPTIEEGKLSGQPGREANPSWDGFGV
jgi:hypothetical protein